MTIVETIERAIEQLPPNEQAYIWTPPGLQGKDR